MSEIYFKRDTSFRKQFFVPDSFAHPAKMDAQLLLWIVERYTKEGETILDPMAGSGTMMLACTLGRDVVLVELEEKFCKMMRANWEQVKMRPQLGSQMGNCQIIQGDARQLEGLVDHIVTSPPHGGSVGTRAGGTMRWTPKDQERQVNQNVTYSDNPSNIGNLPYGQIDSIVTSPPYEEAMGEKHHSPRADKLAQEKSNPTTYTEVDSIITSPPYEGTTGEGKEIGSEGHAVGAFHYGNDNRQIGNLKNSSYLEAMLLVYKNCYSALRPGGLMILVTKNFIRNKQVIRLDLDTIKLCEQAGFTYLERHYRKLPSQSFWRVIYAKKYPLAPILDKEDVLVFKKNNNLTPSPHLRLSSERAEREGEC